LNTAFRPRENDMDRNIKSSKTGSDFGPKLALLATAAIATVALPTEAMAGTPRAEVSYSKAEKALNKGKIEKAVNYAEAAVAAEPRNASYRALLGTVYLESGRYKSAAQSFADALALGDTDTRTVISYALTHTALGQGKAAQKELLQWESALDPADAGLALALAGNPKRGVFVLTNALRSGHNSAKVRQNLAYTYALDGNWRAARVMAAEDVPADKLDARLSQWASQARPEDYMGRVSSLLGINPVADGGVPTRLALAKAPVAKPVVAQAPAPKKAVAKKATPNKVAKAPSKPVTKVAKAPAKPVAKAPVKTVAKAPAKKPAPVLVTMPKPAKAPAVRSPARMPTKVAAAPKPAPRFVSQPVTQALPATPAPQRVAQAPEKKPAAKAPVRAAAAPKGDTHLVQLGSYISDEEAKRGWVSLQRKFPQLKDHDVVITKAEVKGKTYYRVAAAGFGRQGAANMCSAVKSAGRGCFAYTKGNPPAGAVDKGTRIAAAR
jgi:tetratricopeptide (TPR) repeat protein